MLFFWTGTVIAEEATIRTSVDCSNIVDDTVRVYHEQVLIYTFTFTDTSGVCSGEFKTSALTEGVNTFTFGTGDAATDAHAVPYYINFGLKSPSTPIITTGTILSWTAGAGDVAGYSVFYDTVKGGTTNEIDVGATTSLDLSTLSLADGRYFFAVSPYDATGYYGKSVMFTVVMIDGTSRIVKGSATRIILLKKKRSIQ